MNEEEKKAVEILKGLYTDDCINNDVVQTIINLIDKQQKEIEDLKAITRTYEAYKVEEDEKIVVASKEYFINGFFKDFLSDYISKDKMKAKKEEYKKKCDECYFNKSRICKELKAYNCCSIQGALELLNELLGE